MTTPSDAPPESPRLAYADPELRGLLGPQNALTEYITFASAAAELPRGRGGRKRHVATLHRWAGPGCRGTRLRYIQIGGTRYTTREWLSEFFEALTLLAEQGQGRGAGGPAVRSPAARTRSAAATDRELTRLGI